MSDDHTQDVIEAQDDEFQDDEQSVEAVAAGLAAALRSGNAQASESALANYDALGLDESEYDLGLGPLKRVLTPQEAADNSEVGGGTEQDQEDAAVNASDQTPATTTIGADASEQTLDERVQHLGEDPGADASDVSDENQTDDGEPSNDSDDEV